MLFYRLLFHLTLSTPSFNKWNSTRYRTTPIWRKNPWNHFQFKRTSKNEIHKTMWYVAAFLEYNAFRHRSIWHGFHPSFNNSLDRVSSFQQIPGSRGVSPPSAVRVLRVDVISVSLQLAIAFIPALTMRPFLCTQTYSHHSSSSLISTRTASPCRSPLDRVEQTGKS